MPYNNDKTKIQPQTKIGGFNEIKLQNNPYNIFRKKQAPEWIEIIPKGPEIIARDRRCLNLSQPNKIIDSFINDGKKIVIDFNHQSEWMKQFDAEFVVAGWIEELKVIDDAVWGKVEWREEGRNAIENAQYRYVSPVLHINSDDGEVAKVQSVALTNEPALKIKGLFSKIDEQQKTIPANEDPKDSNHNLEYIQQKLLKAQDDYQKLMLKCQKQEKAKYQQIVENTVDKAVNERKITPASKEYHLEQCKNKKGFENFKQYIQEAGMIIPDHEILTELPNKNDFFDENESKICQQLGISKKQFQEQKNKQKQSKS